MGFDYKIKYSDRKTMAIHILRDETLEVRCNHNVDKRYKITVYRNREYGELFDLNKDPNEINNLWDDKNYEEIKNKLLLKFLWSEFEIEPMNMPRIFIS